MESSQMYQIKIAPQYKLSFSEVQEVMNMHRRGYSCHAALWNLSLTTDWIIEPAQYPFGLDIKEMSYITKCSVSPSIINDNLMMCTKQHMFVSQQMHDTLKPLGSDYTTGNLVGRTLRACRAHSQADIERAVDLSLAKLVEDNHWEFAGYTSKKTTRCVCCLSEFTLAIYNHPDKGFEIVLTTWVNLGPCDWEHQRGWHLATWSRLDIIKIDTMTLEKYKASLGYPSDHGFAPSNSSTGRQINTNDYSYSPSHQEESLGWPYKLLICLVLICCFVGEAIGVLVSNLKHSFCACSGCSEDELPSSSLQEDFNKVYTLRDDDLVFFTHEESIPEHILDPSFAHPTQEHVAAEEDTESTTTEEIDQRVLPEDDPPPYETLETRHISKAPGSDHVQADEYVPPSSITPDTNRTIRGFRLKRLWQTWRDNMRSDSPKVHLW